MANTTGRTCQVCGQVIPPTTGRGRPPEYDRADCRRLAEVFQEYRRLQDRILETTASANRDSALYRLRGKVGELRDNLRKG